MEKLLVVWRFCPFCGCEIAELGGDGDSDSEKSVSLYPSPGRTVAGRNEMFLEESILVTICSSSTPFPVDRFCDEYVPVASLREVPYGNFVSTSGIIESVGPTSRKSGYAWRDVFLEMASGTGRCPLTVPFRFYNSYWKNLAPGTQQSRILSVLHHELIVADSVCPLLPVGVKAGTERLSSQMFIPSRPVRLTLAHFRRKPLDRLVGQRDPTFESCTGTPFSPPSALWVE